MLLLITRDVTTHISKVMFLLLSVCPSEEGVYSDPQDKTNLTTKGTPLFTDPIIEEPLFYARTPQLSSLLNTDLTIHTPSKMHYG